MIHIDIANMEIYQWKEDDVESKNKFKNDMEAKIIAILWRK
jgi:hypothetical protein